MSDDNSNSNQSKSPNSADTNNDMSRNRRASITSAAFNNIFQRSNSTSTGTTPMPGPIATAMSDQRRRLSVSTVGLSGTSPTMATPFSLRRGSLSTNGSDESAIEEDDIVPNSARTAPTTPFTRRMSFGAQAMRSMRTGRGNSPGTNGMTEPAVRPRRSSASGSLPFQTQAAPSAPVVFTSPAKPLQPTAAPHNRTVIDAAMSAARSTDQGFNWSEQLRSRAESTVASGSRPSFPFGGPMGTSPPRAGVAGVNHDRAKSVSDMPAPPTQQPPAKPAPRKPDAFQERILKGDFYMD